MGASQSLQKKVSKKGLKKRSTKCLFPRDRRGGPSQIAPDNGISMRYHSGHFYASDVRGQKKKPLRYQDYLRYFPFFSSSTMYGITMAVQVHILFHEVHLFASKKGQTGLFILFSSFLSSLSCPPIHGKSYGK